MPPQLRTLFVLGRVSNLPTVWSNCLAGWWLAGGGNYWKLPWLLLGTSLLYTGGMFLNDAFDEEFDRRRRPERPIPSGKISPQLVWRYGFGQLGLGVFLLLFCGPLAALAALFLVLFILLYDFTHKFFTASPWLMGGCRFWVYVIAGATGVDGLNGWPIVGGIALALYIVGLSYVARRESFRGIVPHWPLIFLAAPVLLSLLMNTGDYRTHALWFALILIGWTTRCVKDILLKGAGNIGWTVTNLLAGIVFVDWLIVAPDLRFIPGAIVFLALFGLTKLSQKFVPAT
ncbi:MAG TPA: UbiA family prenyltransferase [Verrucomicrobiae bacterium]|jgi:4-hydroxybenzoate polyprenyltransferase